MRRILLVDDSKLTLRIEEMLLNAEGRYEIMTATSGEEAVQKALESRPELVLTDLNMPGLDGEQVCRALAQDSRTRHIKVVVVTTENSLERLDPRADRLLKPFDGPTLRRKVAACLL
jgi:CheY-like chemotaxis protein